MREPDPCQTCVYWMADKVPPPFLRAGLCYWSNALSFARLSLIMCLSIHNLKISKKIPPGNRKKNSGE